MAQTIFKKGIVEKLRTFIPLQPKIEVKYCRLCLLSIDNHFKKLFSLFNPKQNVAEVIEDFAKVTISEEDQYSKFICLNCFSKLTECENFKSLIENSDLKLQNQQTRCYDPIETSTANNESVVDEDCEDRKIDVDEIVIKKELISNEIELDDDVLDRFVERNELIKDEAVEVESKNLKNLVENSDIELRSQQTRCHDLVKTSRADNEYINDDDSEDKKIDVDEIDIKKELESSGIELDEAAFDNLIKREELIEDPIDNSKDEESDVEMTKNVTLKKTETGRKCIKKSYNLKCPDCDKVFTQRYSLAVHMYSHTNNYPFHCSYCSKGLPTISKLRLHEQTHTNKAKYECEVCGESFKTRTFLSKHSRSHQSEEFSSRGCIDVRKRYNLKCPECDQTFPYHSALKNHMITHTGIYPLHCSFCKKGFARAVPLKHHELTHTGGTQHRCEICGKGFIQRQGFVYHMMNHKGIKPFKCERCNKKFVNKHILNRHMINVHSSITEEPNFTCEICRKQFRSDYYLFKHAQKCHVPHTLITCDICGKTVRNYKKHMNYHLKPYKCTECKESFHSGDSLRAHSTVHTGKPFYECKICPKRFHYNSSLFTHMKTHDSKNSKIYFKCEFCDKQFQYKHRWKKHLEKHINKIN